MNVVLGTLSAVLAGLVVPALAAAPTATPSGATLVQDGTPRARIVLPPQAPPVERVAALELQRYLREMSGATLPLTPERDPQGGNVLLGAAASGAGLDLSEAALGFDGYVVRTSGRDLILAGRQPYSTLYAVYHLLERHLGCGFFEDGEQVPHRPTLQLPALKDVVDYGRTYLGAMFNDRLGRARKALRDKDQATFEKNAQEIEELMHFMARYCSAHPRLRLKTYDDWARQSPEVLPGYDNAESNWITFTALISPKYWNFLLDYMAEDLAELVEYYFWPRVRLYLEEMRKYVAAGQDISGRLTNRNSDQDMLYRVSDFVPPQGKLPWSPYGNTCEPELTAGNDTSPPLVLKDKGRRLS